MTGRLLSLQILRFLAAGAVVVMHAAHLARVEAGWGAAPYYPTDIGAAGVDVFFVLSGFVIARTGPLAQRRPSGAQFFWRRWSRVAPLSYLLSAPLIVLAVSQGRANWPQTIATFLFWPVSGRWVVQPYLAAGWTLCFEMVFYSAVSAALIGGRLPRNGLVLLAAALALAATRAAIDTPTLRFLANPILLEFGAGLALAWAWPRLDAAPPALGALLIAAALGAFAVQAVFGAGDAISWQATLSGSDPLHRLIAFGGPAAALVGGALICERWIGGPAATAAAWLGDASYSTYLVAGAAMTGMGQAWASFIGPGRPIAETLVLTLAALGLGAACYLGVERPLMRALRRSPRRATAVAAAVA